MRVLMVSPYPPLRDGIAAYAVQAVAALRAAGEDVEVLSPGPSAAHHHLDLVGPRGALALAKRSRHYDKVVVQFHPDVFYPVPSSSRQRTATSTALTAAFRAAREVEVRVHEIDYRTGRALGPEGLAARTLWRSVTRIVVHTESERADFVRAFGVRPERVVLAPHGEHFARRTRHDRASARRSLGLPAEGHVFLAIGFIQPHKGFDRAVRAFTGLGASGAQLHVVGSVRVEEPAYVAHFNELQAMTSATAGAELHTGFVSDELFDRWLVAADTVVLPYREIWSSGVMERAALYGTPVIATAVGGLPQQAAARSDVVLVEDDAELRDQMWTAARGGVDGAPVERAPWPSAGADELQPTVQSEVRRRAALDRGSPVVTGAGPLGSGGATTLVSEDVARATAPLRRVSPLQLPPPTAHRSGPALVKRVVRRLTAWQLEPVVGQINALRAATVEALERSAALGDTASTRGVAGQAASGSEPASASRSAGERPAG